MFKFERVVVLLAFTVFFVLETVVETKNEPIIANGELNEIDSRLQNSQKLLASVGS